VQGSEFIGNSLSNQQMHIGVKPPPKYKTTASTMKRGKPLQGLGPEKAQIKTVLDMRYASNGRGCRAKLMVNCNG
jgi:hypothetical protein